MCVCVLYVIDAILFVEKDDRLSQPYRDTTAVVLPIKSNNATLRIRKCLLLCVCLPRRPDFLFFREFKSDLGVDDAFPFLADSDYGAAAAAAPAPI